ncbi:unnamed protein product [Dovyalis caffra]|uniref:MADS-box domain-containing protein n=1 Tax=Dovyalis caffra TaxID=77055 RepID=A0AAV1R990_9ROSI|nr:unnamed protein product [Dovyalis caffra]
MATRSQQTATKRENFMKKINGGDKVTQAASFSKRKPTLKKKAVELKTLCAVTICMVCFGPDGSIETYPENAEEVRKEIGFYKGLHASQKREFNLLSYLEDGKRKLESKREKVRRKNLEALTESLSNQIEGLSGDALFFFIKTLEKQLPGLKEKIRMLSSRDDKGKAIAHDNDDDHANIVSVDKDMFGESPVPSATIDPVAAWPALVTNDNIVDQNNNTLSSNQANSIVHEDLDLFFWDSNQLLLELPCLGSEPSNPVQ